MSNKYRLTPQFATERADLMEQYREGTLSSTKVEIALQKMILQAANQGRIFDSATGELTLGFVYSNRGAHDRALAIVRHATKKFESINQSGRLASCHIAAGEIYRQQGHWNEADRSFKLAEQEAIKGNSEDNRMFAIGNRGHVALARGDYQSAQHLLDETLDILDKQFKGRSDWMTSYGEVLCEYKSALAETLFYLGRHDDCWHHIDEVYTIAQQTNGALPLAYVHRVIALLLSERFDLSFDSRVQDFGYHITEAYHIFTDLSAALEAIKCLEIHAQVLTKAGNTSEAIKKYDAAIQAYNHMGLFELARKTAKQKSIHTNRNS